MRKSWPFALVVIVVGGVAGLAIAGRPETVDPFVLGPGTTGAISTSSTSVSASTTSTSEPATTTTIEATTTVPPSTSVAATIVPATEAPTTTEAPTATTIPGPLPRNQIRLVIANGDGRFRLASITADRIRSLGYIIALGDALNTVDATVIYYRPDFDDEAAFAAIDIDVPDAIILPFPFNASQPITDSDDSGDVIIVLGPDAPR
jgi:LytR cell envelope-related transcriptional attenuator